MKCDWCHEEILGGELSDIVKGGNFHSECALRSVVGSVGHQLHECSCFGGDHEDPPGMTKREAAQAAECLSRLLFAFRKLWEEKTV